MLTRKRNCGASPARGSRSTRLSSTSTAAAPQFSSAYTSFGLLRTDAHRHPHRGEPRERERRDHELEPVAQQQRDTIAAADTARSTTRRPVRRRVWTPRARSTAAAPQMTASPSGRARNRLLQQRVHAARALDKTTHTPPVAVVHLVMDRRDRSEPGRHVDSSTARHCAAAGSLTSPAALAPRSITNSAIEQRARVVEVGLRISTTASDVPCSA